MTLPNFLYVGSPKAGSTWIFEALRAHPEVFIPEAKYVQYFTRYYPRGADWYRKQFRGATGQHTAIGEVNASLMCKRDAIERMAALVPNAKLLISARNPMERDWSAYLFRQRNGEVRGSFREAIDGSDHFVSRASHYIDCIRDLEQYFPRDQLGIFVFDDLKSDPRAFARSIFEFLDVDSEFEFNNAGRKAYAASRARIQWIATGIKKVSVLARDLGMTRMIARAKKSRLLMKTLYVPIDKSKTKQIPLEDWMFLCERYADGINRLGRYLQRDLSHWFDPPSHLHALADACNLKQTVAPQ